MATGERSPGVGVLAALEGAGLVAWNLVATPLVEKKRRRWGTQGTEALPILGEIAAILVPRGRCVESLFLDDRDPGSPRPLRPA